MRANGLRVNHYDFVALIVDEFFSTVPERISINPRANGAKRRSGRKPEARVTNSARLFTPGEKDGISGFKSGCHRHRDYK